MSSGRSTRTRAAKRSGESVPSDSTPKKAKKSAPVYYDSDDSSDDDESSKPGSGNSGVPTSPSPKDAAKRDDTIALPVGAVVFAASDARPSKKIKEIEVFINEQGLDNIPVELKVDAWGYSAQERKSNRQQAVRFGSTHEHM